MVMCAAMSAYCAEQKVMSIMEEPRLAYRIDRIKTAKTIEFTFEITNNEKMKISPNAEVYLMSDLKTIVDFSKVGLKDMKPGETRIATISFKKTKLEPYYIARIQAGITRTHTVVKASSLDFEKLGLDQKNLWLIYLSWHNEARKIAFRKAHGR
jgi:hypothetical protein